MRCGGTGADGQGKNSKRTKYLHAAARRAGTITEPEVPLVMSCRMGPKLAHKWNEEKIHHTWLWNCWGPTAEDPTGAVKQ